MKRFLFFCMLVFPLTLQAAEPGAINLSSPHMKPGGVALLEYRGPAPASSIARVNNNMFYLEETDYGARALVGFDISAPPGVYPLSVIVTLPSGENRHYHTEIEVRDAQRGAERLTLPARRVTPTDPADLARIKKERARLNKLFGAQTVPVQWNSFQKPVPHEISSPFGLKRILNGVPRSAHSGIDYRSPLGTPVNAAAGGTAVLAEDLFYTGNTVILDHGEGLYTLYAHLHTIDINTGQKILQGQPLGTVGSTGRSTGAHLHWGAKLRGMKVNPQDLILLKTP